MITHPDSVRQAQPRRLLIFFWFEIVAFRAIGVIVLGVTVLSRP
jgi:hypothetical protein